MSLGGITEDFTEKVHPQIKYICETLASSIHAYTLGVDIICQDISQPLTVTNGSIIEINTMPEGYLNTFPVIGKQYPEIGEIYVKGLLEKLTQVKQVIVTPSRFVSENKHLASSINHQKLNLNKSNIKYLKSRPNIIYSISEIIDFLREKIELPANARIGIYQQGKMYINDVLINDHIETQSATEALKLNASLDVIVFSYQDIEEVKEHGFGFDRVDLWIE
jgi:hypothetical protein